MLSSCLAGPHISVSDNGERPAGESIFAPKLQKKQRGLPGAGLWKKTFTILLTGKIDPPIKHTPTAVLLMSGHH